MNRRVSLEQLLHSTTLQPAEAVAIVQQLILTPPPASLTPPLGPPTTATVFVAADGSVSCATSDATLAVSELASLLDAILPAGITAVGVPGGLRYTIARARMEVDAPPFDSVDDFSRALARHERGDRGAVIQRMIARINRTRADGPLDRRRADPAIAQLRRQLRDADARVYDQQRAIDALSVMTTQPPSPKRGVAVAAGLLLGLTFVGASAAVRDRPTPQPSPLVQTQQAQTREAEPASRPAPAPPASASTPRTATPNAITTPAPRRATQVRARSRDREPARPRRFQWLRTRFSLRADPL